MIVLPYLGHAAARRELRQASPTLLREHEQGGPGAPIRSRTSEMRITYRTVSVSCESSPRTPVE